MRRRTIIAAGLSMPLTGCVSQDSQPKEPPSTTVTASPTPSGTSTSSSASPTSAPSHASTATSRPTPIRMNPRAVEIAKKLSPEQRAGQCILVGVVPSDSPEYITNLIDTQCLAGIFLLGHWTSRSKLEAMLSAVNHVSPQGIKPIDATDHEGGEIQNIRVPGVDHLPSQEALARMSPAKVQAVVTTGARQLAKLGVHMVFSPVAGVIDPRLVRNKPIAKHHRVSEPIRTSAGNTRQPSLRDTAKRGSFRPLSIFLASDGSRRILTSNPPGLLTTRPPATTDILSLSGWPLTLDLKRHDRIRVLLKDRSRHPRVIFIKDYDRYAARRLRLSGTHRVRRPGEFSLSILSRWWSSGKQIRLCRRRSSYHS
ncbi:beta-N-acetylhexosaminidase [Cutibacterium acnes JCM 18918]|nr:beta-N-acetylhexosaminidase [Cutibacterium acnes JCM 18918]